MMTILMMVDHNEYGGVADENDGDAGATDDADENDDDGG